jgi:hypothetical protein
VDDELARAIRHVSDMAIRYSWGATTDTNAGWRRMLEVGRADPEGSRRLILAASLAGLRELKLYGVSEEVCERRSEIARRLNLIRSCRKHPPRPLWTKTQLRLLAKAPDEEVGKRIGRTPGAVRVMRNRQGIRTGLDWRRKPEN